jgi:hypothetical protein
MGVPSEKEYVIIDALCAVADEVGATPVTIALAWVRSCPSVASTLIGARRPDQLQANPAALDLMLTDAQIAKLNEASKPGLPGHHYRWADCGCVAPAGGEYKSLLSQVLTRQEHAIGRSVPKAHQPPAGSASAS